jgi:hypothetical protein
MAILYYRIVATIQKWSILYPEAMKMELLEKADLIKTAGGQVLWLP